jgi:hypothetical protein
MGLNRTQGRWGGDEINHVIDALILNGIGS